MTPAKPSPPADRAAEHPTAGPGWTRRDLEIISRRMAGRPLPPDDRHAVPPPPPPFSRNAAPARRRPRWPTERVAAGGVLGFALLAFIAGALASTERDGAPTTRIETRPPTVGEVATGSPAADAAPTVAAARADAPPSAAPARPEPPASPPSAAAGDGGEAVVRSFYGALGRGDGETASALVVAEKRGSRAYAPQAISRFYGGLREPLRLMAVTPLDGGAFRVRYRYSAGRSRCDGEAVVTLASRDGRDLIRSIRALNGC